MMEELSYAKKNIYEEASPEKIQQIFDYAVGYAKYLDASKTEREAVVHSIKMLEAAGYTEYKLGDKVSVGDKKYFNQHKKALFAFTVGEADIEAEGIRIVAAHIDSPRLDLKQIPIYEEAGMGFLKTHYYGGVKKYQWTALPLALHGVVIKANGESVDVVIGEDDNDPVFYINDLLPHLAAKQSAETLGSAFSGESLNILIGGLPYADKEVSDKIKLTVLSYGRDVTVGTFDIEFGKWTYYALVGTSEGHLWLCQGRSDGMFHWICAKADNALLGSGLPLHIGQDGRGGWKWNFGDSLDDIAIWKRSLTIQEIKQIYLAGRDKKELKDMASTKKASD